jgi:hypothetical protein
MRIPVKFCNKSQRLQTGRSAFLLHLYFICEIISLTIKNSNEIKCLKINNLEHKLSQFADDTTLILDESSSSLNQALEMLSKFAHLSRLNVVFDKTKVIRKNKYSSNSIKNDGNYHGTNIILKCWALLLM